MSAELIAIVAAFVTLGIAMFAGFGWMIHRMDLRIDAVDKHLGDRIDRLADEMTEVKIAIARLEGPPRQLTLSR